MLETFPAVVCDRILRTLHKIAVHHVATNHGARAAFSGIAVHKADVLGVLLHEIEHLCASVKQHDKGGAVVVLPFEVEDFSAKWRLVINGVG